MPMKRYEPEQIVTLLRQVEVEIPNGKTTPQACKEAEITQQTYYRWRKEFGGLKLDQAKRLKELERENAKLSDCGGAVASIGEDWLANFDMHANYIAMGWGGSKSHMRQNSSISGLVPREHRTNFGISGIRGPSKIPFF
jgi:putative transposase